MEYPVLMKSCRSGSVIEFISETTGFVRIVGPKASYIVDTFQECLIPCTDNKRWVAWSPLWIDEKGELI